MSLKREKRNKWREAIRRLLDLAAEYSEVFAREERAAMAGPPNELRKLVFGVVPDDLYPQELGPDEFEKMIKLLRTIARRDATAYSLVLQNILASMGLFWPDGVFKHDFALPDRGRPLSSLSVYAWHHYIPNEHGWRSVASDLIPEKFSGNADEAAKKVRKAARSFMDFRDSVWEAIFPADGDELMRLDDLLGHAGLEEIAKRVIDRKSEAALSEPGQSFPELALVRIGPPPGG